jgi:hypothetical protein
MFFHVDESGNSGNNLFDPNQPILSYGVLSSKLNVDVLAVAEHSRMLRRLSCDSLHANQLKAEGLLTIAPDLAALQNRFDFRFDYYFVDKHSFATVMLFDAVFDAGLNEAVKWDWYWTPLRYPLIAAFATLIDDNILVEAWRLRVLSHAALEKEEPRIVQLLESILRNLHASKLDKRASEVLRDGLLYGIRHPLKMDFGTVSPKSVSPNAICFQFVLSCIAGRQKATKRRAMGITIDVQTEFNPSQLQTFHFYSKIAESFHKAPADKKKYLDHPLHEGAREDVSNLINHFPTERLQIVKSKESIGLQIVDVYLWLANRAVKNSEIHPALVQLAASAMRSSRIDGISMSGMMERWRRFEQNLPPVDSITAQLHEKNNAMIEAHRSKVQAMKLESK